MRKVMLGTAAVLALAAAGSSAASAATVERTISATEGAPFSGALAAVTANCVNPSRAQATITWGDGGPNSTAQITQAGAELTVSGSTTYPEEGSFAGTVTGSFFCDAGGTHTFETGFVASVADAPLTITAGPSLPASVTVGQSFTTTIASFTDADPAQTAGDYTAQVQWGDGTSSAGTVVAAANGFAVSATHTYAAANHYAVRVSVTDHGQTVSADGSVDAVVPATSSPAETLRPGPPLTISPTTGPQPRSPRLSVHAITHVGDGTAVLGMNFPRPGSVVIGPVVRHHRLLIAGRRIRVAEAGPLALSLAPTAAERRLLLRVHSVRLTTRLTFKPLVGPSIVRWIPIVFNLNSCSAKVTFTYTGAEQSCVVPPGVFAVKMIAVGGRGGSVSEPCPSSLSCPYANAGGAGGEGALAVDPEVAVHPGEPLYIEVGGNGGDVSYSGQVLGGGHAGAGGWNGGGSGGLPGSGVGSGGGGGASDVQTVSCAQICDQGLGFGAFFALASRVLIAGGGGGGASGGGAGHGGGETRGGDGGFAGWNGEGGNDATISGNDGILGLGGGGAINNGPGAGGAAGYQAACYEGADGKLALGGAGGLDPESYYDGAWAQGFAGGGGGGGYYGGGGGGGGCVSLGNTVGGGGGGGGGSSNGPPGTNVVVNTAGLPASVQVIPLG